MSGLYSTHTCRKLFVIYFLLLNLCISNIDMFSSSNCQYCYVTTVSVIYISLYYRYIRKELCNGNMIKDSYQIYDGCKETHASHGFHILQHLNCICEFVFNFVNVFNSSLINVTLWQTLYSKCLFLSHIHSSCMEISKGY